MNWNAFGAIGEWIGAIAAGAAVWWAVYQTRTRLVSRVRPFFDILSTEPSGDVLIVYAINEGDYQIKFIFSGIRWVGSDEYIFSRVYRRPEKEIVDPNDFCRLMFTVKSLQTRCLELQYSGVKDLVFEFKDTRHKIHSGHLRFNVDTMVVLNAKKTKFA